jgi:hypothetical protein
LVATSVVGEIEIVTQGTIPTGVGTIITSNPFTKIGLTSNTWYDFYIRSLCGNGNSTWTLKNSFNTIANYCGGDHFYDTGGATGNYQNNENYTTVIYPDNPTDKVSVTFNTFQIQSGGQDLMRIYNGTSVNAPQLSVNTGTNSPGTLTSTHSTGALTFFFYSNGSTTYSGWDATINCVHLGVDKNESINIIEFYPNPVTNVLSIKSNELLNKYIVYDINMRVIATEIVNKNEFGIDLSRCSAGSYFVKLFDAEENSKEIKILKK